MSSSSNGVRKRKHSFDHQDLLADIMSSYWHVRQQYEKTVAIDGLMAFSRSRKKSEVKQYDFHITPLQIRECPPLNDKNCAVVRRADTNAIVNKSPLIPIEHIDSTPPMQYWTHTEANIIAKDEYTLSHIPFLGDSVDDTSFCQDLMETFPEGIHGTKMGCGEYINDYILYWMVKLIKEKPRYREIELKIIFKYVYRQFPNKASRNELLEMYPDLQQRFEPRTVRRQVFTNAQGELVANFSPSRLLNSYELLMCHKCFSYDCIMHNATVGDGYGGVKKSRSKRYNGSERNRMSKENNQQLARPCSDTCYLLIAVIGGKGSYVSYAHCKEFKMHLKLEPSKWTPHEESIFGILRKTGESDFCRIARMLNLCTIGKSEKTCQHVFEYASRTAPMSPRLELQTSPVKNSKYRKNRDSHRMFRAMKWANTNGLVENDEMFKPCKHAGECRENADCHCYQVNNLCTKYCGCMDECQNRFPGCRCAPGNCRTKQCQCYYASWECDPDICKSCNCDKIDGSVEPICKNVSIQRGLQKRLIVAPSQVAGWGCFANEDIEKNDFISEYCGEVISQAESERRGKIYDRIKCSYLFGLNDEQVVDATRVGNVIRFANHSQNPNCRAKVIVVNGDHKIGIFAQRPIKSGEELFFNYAYNKSQQVQFVPMELSQILKREKRASRYSGVSRTS